VELKLAGEATDSRSKVKSEASRFLFVTEFFAVTQFFFVMTFFVVAKSFFVTGTIVPIPIPCSGLPLEADLFSVARRYGRGVRRRCRMGFGVAGNYWWQGQNAFSEK
jgi:hypothetical protein